MGTIILFNLLGSFAFAQIPPPCPAIEGAYYSCKFEKVPEGVDPQDMDLIPEFEIIKEDRDGQLSYRRKTDGAGDDQDFTEVLKPGAPTRDFEIAPGVIGYSITDTCKDNTITQVLTTNLKNTRARALPYLFVRTVYSLDAQKNLTFTNYESDEFDGVTVPPTEEWPLQIQVRCLRK